jgi:uncharacterized hydrophobic protein (TIGR00271 family)
VIEVKVSGETATMRRVAARLDAADGVHHVVLTEAVRPGFAVVRADAEPAAVDGLVATLRALGVAPQDLVLTRVEEFGIGLTRGADAAFVWTDVAGLAGSNARLAARYLVFMMVAGVIAAYGVIDRNPILIVGAMAVSPDLLPITAAAVELVARRLRTAARALLVLAAGMGTASLSAAVIVALVNAAGKIPSGFNLDDTVLGGLTTVNDETVVVALVAGIAGMLALETRASSGVGVAISVTTIPAAAYHGVAVGLGEGAQALGALAVLVVNVAMMIVGATLTLVLQRHLRRAPVEV